MRVGILTFHNGTNYGGTLQAFATQEILKSLGHEVIIINYAPLSFRDRFYKCFTTSVKYRNIKSYLLDYFKEPRFREFRKDYMNLSKRYFTQNDIISDIESLKLDACISGSDQVWSPYMAMNWGKPYFQNGFPDNIKRIAYAVSFSCSEYPDNAMNIVIDDIRKFKNISVRENSGLDILSKKNISDVRVMPDPTFLFDINIINNLIKKGEGILNDKGEKFHIKKNGYIYFYILQQNQNLINSVKDYYSDINNNFSNGDIVSSEDRDFRFEGIEEWLAHISNSKLVVTNSFHGAVFSLLLHKPFILIPVEGKLAGMNDRIVSLMTTFGLNNRILKSFNIDDIANIEKDVIDWEFIDCKINDLKNSGIKFISDALDR